MQVIRDHDCERFTNIATELPRKHTVGSVFLGGRSLDRLAVVGVGGVLSTSGTVGDRRRHLDVVRGVAAWWRHRRHPGRRRGGSFRRAAAQQCAQRAAELAAHAAVDEEVQRIAQQNEEVARKLCGRS